MGKRTATQDTPGSPPQKLARRMSALRIAHPADDADDMNGVESPAFYHVSRQDWLDAVNEVEVDDRFTRIPEHVRQPYFERPTTALIPYKHRDPDPVSDASDAHDGPPEDDDAMEA